MKICVACKARSEFQYVLISGAERGTCDRCGAPGVAVLVLSDDATKTPRSDKESQ
jgi:hypothetical protein